MLHVVDLNLMQASARHHAAGQPKDPQEGHRRDHILHLRRARHAALMAGLRKVLGWLKARPAASKALKLRERPH